MQKLDTATAEQVVEVPKISLGTESHSFFVDRRLPQNAEQLVGVPTVTSLSSLQQETAEQIIDIPVPRTRGDLGGLQDFLPDQGLAASSAVSRDEAFQGGTFHQFQKSAQDE